MPHLDLPFVELVDAVEPRDEVRVVGVEVAVTVAAVLEHGRVVDARVATTGNGATSVGLAAAGDNEDDGDDTHPGEHVDIVAAFEPMAAARREKSHVTVTGSRHHLHVAKNPAETAIAQLRPLIEGTANRTGAIGNAGG